MIVPMETIINKFYKAFELSTHFYQREAKEKIIEFCKEVIYLRNISYSLTPANYGEFSDWIFKTDAVQRDFLLDLTFRFYCLLGADPLVHKQLVESLANAICSDFSDVGENQDFIGMPSVMIERLPIISDIRKTLNVNKWLVTLLVMRLAAPKLDFSKSAKVEN